MYVVDALEEMSAIRRRLHEKSNKRSRCDVFSRSGCYNAVIQSADFSLKILSRVCLSRFITRTDQDCCLLLQTFQHSAIDIIRTFTTVGLLHHLLVCVYIFYRLILLLLIVFALDLSQPTALQQSTADVKRPRNVRTDAKDSPWNPKSTILTTLLIISICQNLPFT